jgi:hypothetical protein
MPLLGREREMLCEPRMSVGSPSRCLFAGLLLAACSSETQRGIEVRLLSEPGELSTPATVRTLNDAVVRLDALSWTYTEVELVPCTTLSRRAYDWLVPNAQAHGASTATRLSAPVVQSLGSREPAVFGVLRPPAARYCALKVTLAAADEDAAGLSQNPSMLAKSLDVRGAFGDAAPSLRDFASSTSASAHASVPLDLDLESEPRDVALALTRDPAGWFTHLDPEAGPGPALSEGVLQRFAASTRVRAD